MRDKVLILAANPTFRQSLARMVSEGEHNVTTSPVSNEGLRVFNRTGPDVVLLEINADSSFGILREIKSDRPSTVVILVAPAQQADKINTALRSGADDFIFEPIKGAELGIRLRNSSEKRSSDAKVASLKKTDLQKAGFDKIVGHSPAMKKMLGLARKVAESEVSSILLQGESGTGKECVAKAIHQASTRGHDPLVAINCAAIPPNLVESELFGYEKGAFTDAKARKYGLLEQADGGTIFLDEIGELEINLQAKLLRLVEENTFRRVGGLKDISFNSRVIVASNRDLEKEVAAGRFRLDLFYRLAVIQVDIPPLRKRGDDVLLLAQHFIGSFGDRMTKRRLIGLSREVESDFKQYEWPGNVRELKNVIERAMVLEDREVISRRSLPQAIAYGTRPANTSHMPLPKFNKDAPFHLPVEGHTLDKIERSCLRQALAHSGGNVTRAAMLLGITRDTLRYRLKKHGEMNA
jgi:DNA-binding NtrC family response regulator